MVRIRLIPLVLVIALAGCSGGASIDERDGVRALIGADKDGGRDAMIVGMVLLTEGWCLGLDRGDGQRTLLVWPAGVTLLTDGRPGVRVPDLGDVLVGQRIEAGGGYEASPPEGFEPADVADCAADHQEVAVIDDVATLRKVRRAF